MQEKIESIVELDAFLERHFPNDRIIPTMTGEKHPMFCHRNGQWTRHKFQEFLGKKVSDEYDFAVLLQDLAVVDVDSVELADELERKYEILKSVPTETTRRGRHYWFRRSRLANEEGFFDAAGQVTKGIDFKTRCWTGTSGVIMVAPSKNKSWKIGLTLERLIEIPDDLLRAVSVPKFNSKSSNVLKFQDVVYTAYSRDFLAQMGYFDLFFEEDIGNEVIPVPCTSEEFSSVFAFYEKNYLSNSSRFRTAVDVADKLLMKDCFKKTSDIIAQMMFQKDYSDFYAHDADKMIPLSESIRYIGLPNIPKQTRLFPSITRQAGRFIVGDEVVSADLIEDVKKDGGRIDKMVYGLLKRHNLVLAGGSALWACCPNMSTGSDYDLFVYGVDDAGADAILSDVTIELAAYGFKCLKTDRAVTFISDQHKDLIIQIILRIYSKPQDVSTSFDIAPCKVSIWHCKDTGEIKVEAPEAFVTSIRHGAFIVPVKVWNNASASRIMKYVSKGFDAYLPGLRRSCVDLGALAVKPTVAPEEMKHGCLFYAERRVAELFGPHRPDCSHTLWRIMKEMFSLKSGYENEEIYADLLSFSCRAYQIMSNFIKNGIKRISGLLMGGCQDKKVLYTEFEDMVFWQTYDPKNKSTAFPSHDPAISETHDIASYKHVACFELGMDDLPSALDDGSGGKTGSGAFCALVEEYIPKSIIKNSDIYQECLEQAMKDLPSTASDVPFYSRIDSHVKRLLVRLHACSKEYTLALDRFTKRRVIQTLLFMGGGSLSRGLDAFSAFQNEKSDLGEGELFVDACIAEIESLTKHSRSKKALDQAKTMRSELVKIYRLYGAYRCMSFFEFLNICHFRSANICIIS